MLYSWPVRALDDTTGCDAAISYHARLTKKVREQDCATNWQISYYLSLPCACPRRPGTTLGHPYSGGDDLGLVVAEARTLVILLGVDVLVSSGAAIHMKKRQALLTGMIEGALITQPVPICVGEGPGDVLQAEQSPSAG